MTEKFDFIKPHNVIFFTGAPLSGKSTIAPELNARFNNSVMQHMDVIRLLSQEVELQKPEDQRNNFVFYGSTDAYKLVGDGSYSPERLVEGYRLYSMAVSRLLFSVFNKLNPEDIDNMTIEGVQIMPELVAPHLKRDGSGLIVLTADEKQFTHNRNKVFSDDTIKAKYSNDRLMLVQNEILRQTNGLPKDKVMIAENTGNVDQVVGMMLQFLTKNNFITPSV